MNPGTLNSLRSSCLSFLRPSIIGVCHHNRQVLETITSSYGSTLLSSSYLSILAFLLVSSGKDSLLLFLLPIPFLFVFCFGKSSPVKFRFLLLHQDYSVEVISALSTILLSTFHRHLVQTPILGKELSEAVFTEGPSIELCLTIVTLSWLPFLVILAQYLNTKEL